MRCPQLINTYQKEIKKIHHLIIVSQNVENGLSEHTCESKKSTDRIFFLEMDSRDQETPLCHWTDSFSFQAHNQYLKVRRNLSDLQDTLVAVGIQSSHRINTDGDNRKG